MLTFKHQAYYELILASFIWGFCFIAVAWALKELQPAEILISRFIVAICVGELISFYKNGRQNFSKKFWIDFKNAVPAGVLLAGYLLMQTIGLQYTTVTKSGFLTTLYILFVPLLNDWLYKQKSDFKLYFFILIACYGTYLLLDVNLSGFNKGDVWTLGCALVGAIQILFIDRVSKTVSDSFRYNNFQSFWALIFCLPQLYFQEDISFHITTFQTVAGLLILGLGGSMIAFFLQFKAQKTLSPTTSSMLFLLESPFAYLFAFSILGEKLNGLQLLGAFLILFSSYLTIRWEKRA